MQIAKPQVYLKKENATGIYHIHVVTWFDYSKFKADGVGAISTSANDGTFLITLNVTEDTSIPNMKLLTPVVHTLTLTGVVLSADSPFIEVEVVSSADGTKKGKQKAHMDDADDSSMPMPEIKLAS
jgi:hypothetical protein